MPIGQTVVAQASAPSFEVQIRAALPTAKTTPLGASESMEQSVATSTAIQREPYNAGHDWTSGFIAAGGALLGALIIVLLLVLVASSRHQDHA